MTKEKNIGNLIIQEVSRILTSHLNSSGISYVNKPSCSEHCIEPAMRFRLLFKNRYNGIDALRKDLLWEILTTFLHFFQVTRKTSHSFSTL